MRGESSRRPCARRGERASERSRLRSGSSLTRPFGARRTLAALAVLVSTTHPASAQFQEPRLVSSGKGAVTEHTLGLDGFENVHVARVEAGALILRSLLVTQEEIDAVVAENTAEPRLAFRGFDTAVGFTQRADGAGPRRIVVRRGFGPNATDPVAFSPADVDASSPSLALDARRHAVLVWTEPSRRPGSTEREIVFFREGASSGPRISLGEGSHPRLTLDRTDRAHIVFARAGQIWYVTDAGSREPSIFAEPVRLARSLPGPLHSPSCGIDTAATVWVAFASDAGIHLISNRLGTFPPVSPPLVSAPAPPQGIDSFRLEVSPLGVIGLVYQLPDAIEYVLGSRLFLPPPARVPESVAAGSRAPSIGSDRFANVLVAFEREGDVFLTTNAGAPQAAFRAEPLRGEAPLAVRFTNESRGAINGHHWEFGDGATSRERDPVHVFEAPGEYIVTLRVSGPGGVSELLAESTVRVANPANQVWIADVSAFPGQTGVHVPVLLTHDNQVQGFQLAGVFRPEDLEIRRLDFTISNVGGYVPELAAFNVSHDPEDPFFTAGVLFDIQPPFDRRTLPPGRGQRIANLVVDVRDDVEPEQDSLIELRDGVGRPPLANILTVAARTVPPRIGEPGRVHVETIRPIRFFIRGDTDGNGLVNLSDAIQILNYLFLGGESAVCEDASDASDNGRIDLTDALTILNFLFRAGPYLLPPFPDGGIDPTPDDLSPCRF